MGEREAPETSVVAQRLSRLFEVCQPLGRRYTLHEVVSGVNEAAGRELISVQYLSQLRKGTRADPSYAKLAGIARFFGVSVDYFGDDEAYHRSEEELRLLNALRNAGVRSLALCAADLSDRDLAVIAEIVERYHASGSRAADPAQSEA